MILDEIVARKREEVARIRKTYDRVELEKDAADAGQPRDFISALEAGGRPAVIAEIKRASPSAGLIRSDFDVASIAEIYERQGAAAISVITDEDFFKGKMEYLQEAKAAVSIPILCKDFIIDPLQVLAARAAGADALLLIAAILDQESLAHLLGMAHSMGMACLVEVHDSEEASRAVSVGARIIGINNRDLRTFQVDLETTLRLRPSIPPDRLVVSESGIHDRSDLQKLAAAGAEAVLVGTSLMRSKDPGQKLRELMRKV